jgi:hypothetical protein
MDAGSSARRGVARHAVLAFVLMSLGIGFVTAAIPPIVNSEILPFGLPLHGVVMSLGAGLAAFLVTVALPGRAGAADLTRRSVRWRVPGALVPDRTVVRSGRGNTDLAKDIRATSSGNALRWLVASAG